jgi:hypothetical protein
MKTLFGILLTLIILILVVALFYSIIFGHRNDWKLPFGLLVLFWFGGGILVSILQAIFGFKI